MIWVRVYEEGGGVNKAAAPDFETCSANTHTHTHTRNRMPDEKYYLKHIRILENVVNICIINDYLIHLRPTLK